MPKPVDFFEALFGDNADEKEVRLQVDITSRLLESAAPELAAATRRMQTVGKLLSREPVLLMAPFDLRVE